MASKKRKISEISPSLFDAERRADAADADASAAALRYTRLRDALALADEYRRCVLAETSLATILDKAGVTDAPTQLFDVEAAFNGVLGFVEKHPTHIDKSRLALQTWLFRVWAIDALEHRRWRAQMGLTVLKCVLVASVLEKLHIEATLNQTHEQHVPPYLRGLFTQLAELIFTDNDEEKGNFFTRLFTV